MVIELTDFERSLFHSAWLAWKDITQPDFVKTFNPVRLDSSIEFRFPFGKSQK